jgi:hypothetical protein
MRTERTISLAVLLAIILLYVSAVPLLAQWTTSTLSQARSHLAATTLGTKVMFIGGLSGSPTNTFYATVDMFDAAGTLTITQQLSQARSDLAVTTLGTKAYFGGGRNNSGYVDVVDVYDLVSGWGTPLQLSVPRAYLGAVAAGNKVFFAGGYAGSAMLSKVDIFDISNNSHTQTDLSQGRSPVSEFVDNKVIFAGGHLGSSVFSDVIDIYDINTGWVTHTLKLSQARGFMCSAKIGKKVFFAGGQGAAGVSNVVDIIDFTNPEAPVMSTTTLPNARKYLSAAAAGTKVFFAGGYEGTNTPLDFVDIYDTSTNTWLPADHLTQARGTLSATSLGTKVFFGGGSSGTSTVYNIVSIYDTETTPPEGDTFSPLDNATGVSVNADLVITFNEGIKKGTGNIVIKEGGVFKKNVAITDPGVTISNSNKTLTIPQAGFTSNSQVNIEIAAGVIKDLAGNNYAGISNATTWNFTTEILVLVESQSLPLFLTKGSATEKASITVNDATKVSKVFFKSWGISEPDEPRTPVEITANGNVFEKTFTAADMSDPIGLYYLFEVTDITQNKLPVEDKRAYIKYPDGQVIPSLAAGDTESAYRIISVPLKLEKEGVLDVFKDLVGEDQTYNKEKWRLYTYDNEDNREFKEYANFTKIVPGKGYWLIFRNQTTINVGSGQTVPFYDDANDVPFKITLNPNSWTLIGNPYNFKISWSEVVAANPGLTSAIDQSLSVFEGGNSLVPATDLDAFQGAFVHSDNSSPVELIVPVKNTSNGRLASTQDEEINLTAKNWQLPLTLTDGELTNALGGIGMNSQATTTGKDRFDAVCVPLLEGIGMFEMAFAHPESKADFSREIVPPAENYAWNFSINRTTDKPVKITWNNSLILNTEKQLFLYDPSQQVMKNMKTENYYIVLPSSNNLRVFFGNAEFIRYQMDEFLPVFNFPYPNPASEIVTIPFYVPAALDEIAVSIKVYTAQGAQLTTVTDDTYTKGSHEVVWETNGKSGLYLIHMKAGAKENKWVKVLVK